MWGEGKLLSVPCLTEQNMINWLYYICKYFVVNCIYLQSNLFDTDTKEVELSDHVMGVSVL